MNGRFHKQQQIFTIKQASLEGIKKDTSLIVFLCQINYCLEIVNEAMVKILLSDGMLLQHHKKHYFTPNSDSISIDIHRHISPNPKNFLQPHKNPPQ